MSGNTAAMPPTADARERGCASPELRRVLTNIRVIVAIVAATEAMSLPAASRNATMLAVLAYAAYAGSLCWIELNGQRAICSRLTSWIDAIWMLLIVWLADSLSSLFVLLLLFPVLFASLSFGFLSGLAVSLFAAGASAAELAFQAQQHPGELTSGTFLQPISLLLLGPLVAGLARAGVRMSAQQSAADELLEAADPRLGTKQVAETVMRILMRRFESQAALMLVWLPDCPPRLFRCESDGRVTEPDASARDPLIATLSELPSDIAAAHHLVHALPSVPIPYHSGLHVETGESSAAARTLVEKLAAHLEARSLLAIPICRRSPHPSRLVLISRSRLYRASDAEVLCAVMDRLAPVIENASLLEQLTEEAMATERARIGRDLHDKAIQPYLGLKYGVEALARKAAPDNPLYRDVNALQQIVIEELHQLREMVSGMRSGGSGADNAIGPVLRRQARRFSELFGITVSVDCDDTLAVGRRLTAELFPLISEALTNIRRHTRATHADVQLRDDEHRYVLRISNPHDVAQPPAPFTPRSIRERAEFLQGCALVDLQRPGVTDLIIHIPKQF